jgi:hypothetical protein
MARPAAAASFVSSATNRRRTCASARARTALRDAPLPFALDVAASTSKLPPQGSSAPRDRNGKEFRVGGIVRVTESGLKAYQVVPKARGSYDASTKAFVPDANAKYLVLPVGLRGAVTKVYDVEEISANFPIQVRFAPGENSDEEGYDPPVAFLMHFLPDEIECV